MLGYIQQVRNALKRRWWKWGLDRQAVAVLLGEYDRRGEAMDEDAETIGRLRRCLVEAEVLLSLDEFTLEGANWRQRYADELEDARDSQ